MDTLKKLGKVIGYFAGAAVISVLVAAAAREVIESVTETAGESNE